LFRAFPDFAMVVDMVAYGEKAARALAWHGHLHRPVRFEGLDPNGARIEIEGLDLLTIRDGLIRENRAYTNAAEIARQLGAMPAPGSLGERAMLGAVNAKTRLRALLRQE
jgi:predicted ester cyclase